MKRPPVVIGNLQLLKRQLRPRGRKLIGVLAVCGFAACIASTSYAEAPNSSAPSSAPVTRAFLASYRAETAGNFDAALSALDALPPNRQGSYTVLLRRGWLAYCGGHHADAIGFYTKAVAAAPESVEPRLGLLLPQMALRRWVDVERVAREVLTRDPGSYLAQMRLGLAQYSLGKFSDAEVSYGKVLALHPADLEARSGLAWALLRQRKNGIAEGHFRSILELSPQHAAANEGMALLRKR